MPERDFPHASIVEGLPFTAQIVAPNVAQGLFRRRQHIAAVATKMGVDGLVVRFMSGLKRSYGESPVWIRVATDEVLLLLGRDGIRRVLEASPDPFAANPEPKKSGMARFQPDALTISRNPEWQDRRGFTEAVLDTGKPLHRLADSFAAVSVREAASLPSELDWDTWSSAVRRVTRRVVLGEGAADDEELSEMLGELMEKSNPPGTGSTELYERYTSTLQGYVRAAAPDSLVGLFADVPVTECTEPSGQVTHWLFALADTLAINVLRCLALLATFDDERARVLEELADADLQTGAGIAACKRLGASLQETMRLWPTTGVLSRETIEDTDWGRDQPAGRHADPDRQHVHSPRPRRDRLRRPIRARAMAVWRRCGGLVVQPLQPRAAELPRSRARAVRRHGDARDGAARPRGDRGGASARSRQAASTHARLLLPALQAVASNVRLARRVGPGSRYFHVNVPGARLCSV